MPHLASIVDQAAAKAATLKSQQDFDQNFVGEDEFTASVYGSKFAIADLPKIEMPETEMPKEVAYRLIKDDLTLDGVPTLK